MKDSFRGSDISVLTCSSRNGQTPPRRVVLVTPYPYHGQRSISGVASYSRELLGALLAMGLDVEVWAERGVEDSHQLKMESDRVIRTWRLGLWAGLDLWRTMHARRPTVLHVQMEYFIFGGWLGFVSLMAFLGVARFAGLRVLATAHQVLRLQGLRREVLHQFGVKMPVWVARFLGYLSFVLLGKLADVIFVHEEVFRDRLVREYGIDPRRVAVVRHGVPDVQGTRRLRRSRRLLIFGYLKWYKGFDIVLRAFREVAPEFPDWKLVVAGGLPSGLGRTHPHTRFSDILSALAYPLGDRVEFLGYVGDAEIPELFQRVDLVLFPYRVLFSASGPLALAIGYRKAFVISEALRPLLPTWPIWCKNSPEHWADLLRRFMEDEARIAHVEELSGILISSRTWEEVARRMLEGYGPAGLLIPVTDRVP